MYIVVSRRPDGTFIPSPRPRVHESLVDAQNEAKRLAKAFPSIAFHPFKMLKGERVAGKQYAQVFD